MSWDFSYYNENGELTWSDGPHQLSASATVPSGFFTTNVSSWFTNNAAAQTATVWRDTAGNVTEKIWLNANGTTNRTQNFGWDAKERLYTMSETDANGNGFQWFADYDGLDRRIRTQWQATTNGVVYTQPNGYCHRFWRDHCRRGCCAGSMFHFGRSGDGAAA